MGPDGLGRFVKDTTDQKRSQKLSGHEPLNDEVDGAARVLKQFRRLLVGHSRRGTPVDLDHHITSAQLTIGRRAQRHLAVPKKLFSSIPSRENKSPWQPPERWHLAAQL